MENKKIDRIFKFYNQILGLKKLVRKGWERKGIPNPESVADHIFGVSILSLILGRELNLNIEKIITIALVHEVSESIIGDITPYDGISLEDKIKLEEEATKKVLKMIDDSDELYNYWKDFEYGQTPEGRLVKEVDRLEMAFQALEYENDYKMNLDEFYTYVKERLKTPLLHEIFEVIANKRQL